MVADNVPFVPHATDVNVPAAPVPLVVAPAPVVPIAPVVAPVPAVLGDARVVASTPTATGFAVAPQPAIAAAIDAVPAHVLPPAATHANPSPVALAATTPHMAIHMVLHLVARRIRFRTLQ